MTLDKLQKMVEDLDLIGVNLHRNPQGEWNCWTRKRNSEGWTLSGRHKTLEGCIPEAIGKVAEEHESWMDLV